MPIFAAVAGLAGAGASIFGSVNSGNAAKDASKAQQLAAQQAAANFAPWLGGGQSALAQQMQLLGLGNGQSNGFGQPNYAAYVTGNPDILAAYQAGDGKGASIEDFGKWHWNTFGQNEFNAKDPNRTLTPFGPGGQAGAAGGQQSAIDALKQSPFYQSLYHNGEQAILANGAATGGLRGGNTERSLYNLGTDTLASAFQQQFNNLGQLSGLGENAAAGVGNGQIQAGAAQAGGILGGANANNQIANTVAGLPSLFGNQQLLNALGLGGGISTTTSNILGPQYNIPSPVPSIGGLSTSLPGIGETFTPVL